MFASATDSMTPSSEGITNPALASSSGSCSEGVGGALGAPFPDPSRCLFAAAIGVLDADRVPGSSRACTSARSRLGVKADDVHVHRVSVAVAAGHSDQLSRALPAGVWGPALRVPRQTISQLQAVHCAGPFGASCGGWAVGIRGGKRRYKAGGTPPRGRAEERAPERLACRPPSANPLRSTAPSRRQTRATATGRIGRLAPGGARAPGPSIDAAAPAAQRRENGTPSAASWERAHVSLSLETASTPKWPPARAKESGGISPLERAARPLTWVRASRARAPCAQQTRGRLSSWQHPTGDRRGSSYKLIEPETLRALTNAEIAGSNPAAYSTTRDYCFRALRCGLVTSRERQRC